MEENKTAVIPPEKAELTENIKIPKFRISLKLLLILIPLGIIFLFVSLYYLKISFDKFQSRNVSFEKEENVQQQITPIEQEWEVLDDVPSNLRMRYPPYASVEIKDEETNARTITIVNRGAKQTAELKSEFQLEDGYIFKVAYNTINEEIDVPLLAERKKDSFRRDCSEIYSSTETEKIIINSLEAYTFKIQNCPQNIRDIFFKLDNRLYEVRLINRGDIGYKEKYEQDLSEILNSLVILNKGNIENPDYQTYISSDYEFSLEHPTLDSLCCDINLSLFKTAKKLVVLADKQTYQGSGGKEFNGLVIYADENKEKLSVESYIDKQKDLLLTDYKIITGENPSVSQEEVNLDGEDAILLKGYAWWGDIVFVKHPGSSEILILSKLQTKTNSFDTEFKEILKTFRFTSSK